MEKIRVFLADWQVLFREGIHFILSGEEDIEVIGEASDNEEALNAIEANSPQVAILNADHNKPSGIEVTHRIKRNLALISVILVIDTENDDLLLSIMKSGASACLTKEVDPDKVINTIRKVIQGERPISEVLFRPAIASRVIDEFEAFSLVGEEVGSLLAHLLPAEAEILRRIADGSPIEEIALTRDTSEEDIRHLLDLIVSKLVANDRSQEMIEAVQRNLTSMMFRDSKARKTGRPLADYVTKDEFSTFKQTVTERLKSLFGELS
ncbi:response regulator [Chloroflexota bacterium]